MIRILTGLLFLATPALADVSAYCTTSPNSVGAGATLRWQGPVRPQGGHLRVQGLPPRTTGAFVYGLSPDAVPFGAGVRCVGGPAWFLARARSTSQGTVDLDIAVEGEAPDVQWLEANFSSTWHFQFWYRDTAAGSAPNLSDALEVRFE